MLFDFSVRVLLADTGLPDPRFSFQGQAGVIKTGLNQETTYADYPVVADATCQLSARGGCLSGTLEIAGGGIDWPKIEDGQIVEFYWSRFDPTSIFYSGRVARGVERSGTGGTHSYKLQGAWESLEWVTVEDPHFLGFDEGAGGTETAAQCASYYLEIIMGITSADITRDIIDIGDIDDNSTPVKAITITADVKPKEFFETLEFMATGADVASPPRMWIAGVDQNRLFYFKPLAIGSTPALIVQHGSNHAYRPLVDWNEQVITHIPPGRVRVWGGWMEAGVANKIYDNEESGIGSRKVQKPHPIYGETLDSGEDMEYMATGWFRKFGTRIPIVKSMSYVADEPPRPWNGFVQWFRVNEEGEVVDNYKLFWDSAQFSLSRGPVIEIALGDEAEPRTSRNQGRSPVRRMFRDLAGVVDFIYPEQTREEPAAAPGSTLVYLVPHQNIDFYDGGARADGQGGR